MPRVKYYICFDDMDIRFDWTLTQVKEFDKMWSEGYSTKSIAKKFWCKRVEIELLAADRFLRGAIEPRKGNMEGTKEYLTKDKLRIKEVVS